MRHAAAAARWLPIAAFALAAALAAALTAQYIHAMATTSLWVDEYYTQSQFATKGAWVAWTDFHVPNNHVLFSIANSVWPDSLAHEPAPARLFSFLATIAAFVMVAWFATRERAWGGGALALLLLASVQTLDLTLQARGYGFTMLAAVVLATASARYLDDDGRGWLVAVAAAAFAGTATLPIFILLAAPFALGLLALRPRSEGLVVLGVAGLLGIGFYLPTAAQVIAAASTYASDWGTHYATVDAVRQTFLFVLPNGPAGLAPAIAIAIVIGAALVRGEPHRRSFIVLAIASLVVFFAACLIMTTPLVRTTQFAAAVFPVLVVAASGIAALGTRRLGLAGNALLLAVAVPVAIDGLARLRDFAFTPIEAWREAAAVIEAVAPPDLTVYATFRRGQLAVYLEDPERLVDTFDGEAFRRGELVVVDTSFREDVRFAGAEHASGAIDILVPQRRGRHQIVSFVPHRLPVSAEAPGTGASDLARLADGDPATAWSARAGRNLTLVPQAGCNRLVLLGADAGFADGIAIRTGPRGSRETREDEVFRLGRLAVVDLGSTASGPVWIAPRDGAERLKVAEAWCTAPDAPSSAP